MKSQPGTKLKERCEKIHNQETFWLVGSGISTVLFLKGGGVGSHYTADDCKAVLVIESALATCQGHTLVLFDHYSSVIRW